MGKFTKIALKFNVTFFYITIVLFGKIGYNICYNGRKMFFLLFGSKGMKNFMFNIVLVEPEIPQNTGNIARTCAATGSQLHIVKPMGFEIDDRKLKRAGLDYWHLLGVRYYENLAEFFEKTKGARYFYSTTKAKNTYAEAKFEDGDYILFGKETKGLPEELLYKNPDTCIRIPMISEARSLNLSNSVAIVVYEALRQTDFKNLKGNGELTKFAW